MLFLVLDYSFKDVTKLFNMLKRFAFAIFSVSMARASTIVRRASQSQLHSMTKCEYDNKHENSHIKLCFKYFMHFLKSNKSCRFLWHFL